MQSYHTLAQVVTIEAGPSARGEAWTAEDVEFLVEFADLTALELALALGRTEYGVEAARVRLRAGARVGARRTPVRPLSDRVYTFVDGDVPDGW